MLHAVVMTGRCCVQSALPSPAGTRVSSGLSAGLPIDSGSSPGPQRSPVVSKRRSRRRSARAEAAAASGQSGPLAQFQHVIAPTKR